MANYLSDNSFGFHLPRNHFPQDGRVIWKAEEWVRFSWVRRYMTIYGTYEDIWRYYHPKSELFCELLHSGRHLNVLFLSISRALGMVDGCHIAWSEELTAGLWIDKSEVSSSLIISHGILSFCGPHHFSRKVKDTAIMHHAKDSVSGPQSFDIQANLKPPGLQMMDLCGPIMSCWHIFKHVWFGKQMDSDMIWLWFVMALNSGTPWTSLLNQLCPMVSSSSSACPWGQRKQFGGRAIWVLPS